MHLGRYHLLIAFVFIASWLIYAYHGACVSWSCHIETGRVGNSVTYYPNAGVTEYETLSWLFESLKHL